MKLSTQTDSGCGIIPWWQHPATRRRASFAVPVAARFCIVLSYTGSRAWHRFTASNQTVYHVCSRFNALMSTLKPHSNGPSYSNTMIGTLAIDGWAVAFSTARRDWAGCNPAQSFLTVQNVTAQPINGQCIPTSYYLMWHYNCLWILKG